MPKIQEELQELIDSWNDGVTGKGSYAMGRADGKRECAKELEEILVFGDDEYDDWEPRTRHTGYCPECESDDLDWNYTPVGSHPSLIVSCNSCGVEVKINSDIGHYKQMKDREREVYYETNLVRLKVQERPLNLQNLISFARDPTIEKS